MDARTFVASVFRLAPPAERPGARVGGLVDSAYLAAIGEVVRAFGAVSATELVGVEVTGVVPDPDGGPESANVARITDPDEALAELERDGEALVEATVGLEVDREPVGVVVLSLRVER
jgi:hypothetical protein